MMMKRTTKLLKSDYTKMMVIKFTEKHKYVVEIPFQESRNSVKQINHSL